MKSFKEFMLLKENETQQKIDWKKNFIQLEKGFIPPSKMRPIIEAFLKSSEIKVMGDTTKEITMPKKSLFLTGGAARDFIAGKSPREYELTTNATPDQIALILHSAGFRQDPESEHIEKLKTHFKPKIGKPESKKVWGIVETDRKNKPTAVYAKVNDEKFEIHTFRTDPKAGEIKDANFVDNPHADSQGRDLHINAMYIELAKPDGENNKLYDPQKAYYDVKSGKVKAVGKAHDRFAESPERAMRAIRMHSRFGKGEMDPELAKAVKDYSHLEGVNDDDMKDEFLKGLTHPDTNAKTFFNLMKKTGILSKVFPNLSFDDPTGKSDISDTKDKVLSLAWLLQHNPIENIEKTLSDKKWNDAEKRAIKYLLNLKGMNATSNPDCLKKQLQSFFQDREGTGLTNGQIRNWVDMFFDAKLNRNRRPWWAKHIKDLLAHQKSFHPWHAAFADDPDDAMWGMEAKKFLGQ